MGYKVSMSEKMAVNGHGKIFFFFMLSEQPMIRVASVSLSHKNAVAGRGSHLTSLIIKCSWQLIFS